ncbi:hypothetical protein PROFUN_16766, partial [Planoprotostelium fungivorum]
MEPQDIPGFRSSLEVFKLAGNRTHKIAISLKNEDKNIDAIIISKRIRLSEGKRYCLDCNKSYPITILPYRHKCRHDPKEGEIQLKEEGQLRETLRGFDRDGNKAMARVEVILQLHTHREDDGWQSYLNDVEESETTDVIEECIRRHMREKNSRIIIGPDRTRIQSQLDCNDDTFNHAYQRVLREWWERWQEHLNKREPHPTLYVAPLSERAYQSFSAQQLLE